MAQVEFYTLGGSALVAAPSNCSFQCLLKYSNHIYIILDYKCKAFLGGDRAVEGGPGVDIASYVFLKKGLCGLGKMKFYQKNDGKSWKFNEDGGNGMEWHR